MTRVYVAGPMSGIPDLNYPAFQRAAVRLRASGYEVLSPAEINADADKHAPAFGSPDYLQHWRACMRRDIAQLVTCDAIALLPGWERSRGAKLELMVADALGMRRIYMEHFSQAQAAGGGTAIA